ncbi:uncharacterized protein [Asterias amurensis]|uniref:uncharacterized protein n=1 Tax=Asterias amurensis TaxID=7602 RepID=UPI003AB281EE
MAGSDGCASSDVSSGSDGEHSSPRTASSSSPASTTRCKKRDSVSSAAVRHRHRHKLSHRFEFIRTLGCGTYGKVKLAVQLDTREEVAVKCIPKSKVDNAADLRRLRHEIEVMSLLHHPHIIKVTEVFESREKIVMVMEHASGGELYDFINDSKLTVQQTKELFQQIVSAVRYIHKNNIVHRDLKLENILLDSDFKVKIADFGLSSKFDHSRLLDTFCGSPLYASPEIINGSPYHGPEVDCWSLGVILYAMVYRTMPFHGADFNQLKKQIAKGDFVEPPELSDASDLIHRMLTVDPKKRIPIEGIINHPWVRDRGSHPRRKSQDVVRLRQTEILSQSVKSSVEYTRPVVSTTSQETAKKPLASILKKTQRRSSHSPRRENASSESTCLLEEKKATSGPKKEQNETTEPVKKGILKRRAKDSGGDSGLEINESGQNKSGGSLDSTTGDQDKDVILREKNKRDSGIDQDLSCCVSETSSTQYETCKLRVKPRLHFSNISKRHSRGKYSRVTQVWESIYTASQSQETAIQIPPPQNGTTLATLKHDNSTSSNEDILEILDSPALRTPTVKKQFQYLVEETKSLTVDVEHSLSVDVAEDDNYTRDELVSAMDDELLEVYQKALKISQAFK